MRSGTYVIHSMILPEAPLPLRISPPQGFVNILGNMYNNFEVKVPGNVPLNGASWNPSDFSSSL